MITNPNRYLNVQKTILAAQNVLQYITIVYGREIIEPGLASKLYNMFVTRRPDRIFVRTRRCLLYVGRSLTRPTKHTAA